MASLPSGMFFTLKKKNAAIAKPKTPKTTGEFIHEFQDSISTDLLNDVELRRLFPKNDAL
jgi:hypothetical protein